VFDSALLPDSAALAGASVPMLLVEDDEHLAEALTLVLTRNGFQVTWCEDAQEAVECLAAGRRPAVILLDLWTPNMDGWEFRLEQRRQPDWANIPVIALTADRSAKAAAIDVQAFLAKPIDEQLLIRTIHSVLADARQTGTGLGSHAEAPRASTFGSHAEAPRASTFGSHAEAPRASTHRAREKQVTGPTTSGLAATREIDLGNALYMLVDSLDAAHGHCRALTGEVSGLVEARARAMGTLLGSAQRAAQHMEDLTFRSGEQRRTLPLGVIDVGALLRQCLQHVELDLPEGTQIELDIAPHALAVGDARKLSQVFLNVLRNAAEAMVDVSRPALQLEVWPDSDETLSVTISDCGCGMAPGTLERVFDPFYTSGRRRLAQGLGLTVARRLMRELGGSFDLLSSPDLGSTVRVCLRRLRASAAHSEPRSTALQHVLVVDDDLRMLEQLRSALSGQFVVTAMRSWQALHHIYAGHYFDLVLYNNTRTETRALSFFAALAFKFPEQAARVVFLQNSRVERRMRRWLEDVGVWQVEDALIQDGLSRRLDRLLQLWSSIGMRNPRTRRIADTDV
jgi:CheY-like chemotaxis protein